MAFIKGNLFIDGENQIEDEAAGKLITGSATVSSSRFKYGGSSVYFNGATSLTLADHEDFNFGSGDFTIDFWLNLDTLSTTHGYVVYDQWNNVNDRIDIQWTPSQGIAFYRDKGGANFWVIEEGTSSRWEANEWKHVAITRVGTTYKLFINGIKVSEETLSVPDWNVSSSIYLGQHRDYPTAPRFMQGYVDQFRIVKGTALWTENFPLDETALNYGNTGELFIDGEAPIEDENSNHSIINSGAALDTTNYKFGSSSIHFDGSNYLEIPDSNDFFSGGGDFTFDFWVRLEVLTYQYLLCQSQTQDTYRGIIYFEPTQGLSYWLKSDTPLVALTQGNTNGWSTGDWHHVALTKQGATWRLFKDGALIDSVSQTINVNLAAPLTIGAHGAAYEGFKIQGNIDNLRIINGTALFTTNFNMADDTLFYSQDLVNPDVEITTPTSVNFYTTKESTISLGGTASDNEALASVTWQNLRNATSGTAIGLETWTTGNITLENGSNQIDITVTDTSDNTNSDTIWVQRDNTIPLIEIDNPTDNDKYRTAAPNITLTGWASDASGIISVTWDDFRGGSGTAVGTTSWSIVDIPLIEGANTIQVMAYDAAGNMGYDQIVIEKTANSNHLSYIYDVEDEDKRGKASQGFVRPTIKQFFTTVPDFTDIVGSMEATGGIITEINDGGIDYRVHTFLSDGTFTPDIDGTVEYLVVAGGGGSGGHIYGGGGGAGGFRTGTDFAVTAQAYPITIGAGGAGGVSHTGDASNGEDSVFSTITAIGGGSPDFYGDGTAKSGGSGGGGSGSQAGGAGTPGQGYEGGLGTAAGTGGGGGGGGASEAGAAGGDGVGGNGGDGLSSDITGTTVYYAGGGGGATTAAGPQGLGGLGGGGDTNNNGTPNTGGGAGARAGVDGNGFTGGSGIVVIRYQI